MNNLKNFRFWLVLGAIILVLGVVFYLFKINLFADGMFHGGDEAAHMFLPKYVVDYFKEHHRIPVVNPYWYNGTETLHHAPYLIYFPIAAIYLITGNIYLTDRLFTLLMLMAAGMTMFFVLYRRLNLRAAILGGIVYPFSVAIFYLARTSLTRVTPFVLMPLAFYFTDEVLEKKFQFKNFILLTLVIAAMIFAHPITGLTSMIFVTFYSLIRVVADRQVAFLKFLTWLGAFIMASGLIAWYAIPFLLEPVNYTYPAESIITTIAGSSNQEWALMGGFLLIILGLIAFIRKRTQKNWALFFSILFAFFFVTPLSATFYRIFPWGYPFAALVWISIVLIYWTASLFELSNLKLKWQALISIIFIPIIIILALIYSNKNTAFLRLWVEPFERAYPLLNDTLDKFSNPGRVFSFKIVSKEDWIIPAVVKKYFTEGHYFSITRLNKEVAWINDAFNNGYNDYVISRMNLFNDRYFVETWFVERFLNNNPNLREPFFKSMKQAGWDEVMTDPDHPISAIYYKDQPSNYLVPLSEKTLVIGEYGYDYAAFQPRSYVAGSIYLDDYDLDFLKNFDNLVLYGFGYKDKAYAEKLIRDYASSGGNVAIDMLNMQHSKLEAEEIFLGVQSNLEQTTNPIQLESNGLLPSKLQIPSVKYFGEDDTGAAQEQPFKEWRFTDYWNLDGTVSKWINRPDQDDNLYSLIGYKNISGKKIWFLGGNLIYHAYLDHNKQEQDFIRQLTTGETKSQELSNGTPAIDINSQNLDPEAGKMEFSYTAQGDAPLLVSYTISPHWKAYLDGKPLKIYNLDAMMALNLPGGSHHVTLKYENLFDHTFARSVTAVTIVFLIYLYFASRKKRLKDVQE